MIQPLTYLTLKNSQLSCSYCLNDWKIGYQILQLYQIPISLSFISCIYHLPVTPRSHRPLIIYIINEATRVNVYSANLSLCRGPNDLWMTGFVTRNLSTPGLGFFKF